MDSPLATPRTDRTQYSDDDDSDISLLTLLQQWTRSIKPLYRALCAVILGMVLSALVVSSLPLWRPVGMVMLHKLWDVLRFLVLTTSIGLGIINSKMWRGNYTDQDGIASGSGKEDSMSSKVPFAGMFYSDIEPSYSFNQKELDTGENGFASRSVSANGRECGANTTPLSGMSGTTVEGDDKFTKSQNMSKLQDNDTITVVSEIKDGDGQESNASDGGVVEKPPNILSSANNSIVGEALKTPAKRRLRKPRDDMDLATVLENDQPKHTSSKINIHRRGSSLEFPVEQKGAVPRHGDIYSAMDHPQKGELTTGERHSTLTKTASPAFPTCDHVKDTDESSSRKTSMNAASASTSASTSATRTPKHVRSRSAYDLKELLVDEPGPTSKPRSKPGTTPSQLARRRKVSLSCDLDKDYTVSGVPAWLAGLPSPPAPPLIDGYGVGVDANRGVLFCGEINHDGKQDESSLRKAYSESLAPWRAAVNAVPVDIPEKEAIKKETKRHPTTHEQRKKSPLRERKKSPLKQHKGTPPSSPSSPNSFMGSPSPGELNKKVDAFIARFHERMRLQRLESLKRSRARQGPL